MTAGLDRAGNATGPRWTHRGGRSENPTWRIGPLRRHAPYASTRASASASREVADPVRLRREVVVIAGFGDGESVPCERDGVEIHAEVFAIDGAARAGQTCPLSRLAG